MDYRQILEYAKREGTLISEDEAIKLATQQIKRTDRDLPSQEVINFGLSRWLATPEYRNAMRANSADAKETRALIEKYGVPSRYVILHLHPESSIEGIVDVSSQIERQEKFSCLLLASDVVINRHQKDLVERGFDFSPDWMNQDSDYRRLLNAGEREGKIYEMIRKGFGWGYRERVKV